MHIYRSLELLSLVAICKVWTGLSSGVGGQSGNRIACCQKALAACTTSRRLGSCITKHQSLLGYVPSTSHLVPCSTNASTSLTHPKEINSLTSPTNPITAETLPSPQQVPDRKPAGKRWITRIVQTRGMHDSIIAPSRPSEVNPSATRYPRSQPSAPLTCKSQGEQLHCAPLVS